MRMVKLASAIALLAVVLLLWSLQGSDDERAARHAGDTPGAQPEQADLPPEQVSGADLRPVPLPPLDTAIPPNPPDESGRPAAGQAETDADHETWEVLVLGARKQPAIGIRMTLLENRAFSRGLPGKLITDVQGRATFRGDESGFYLSFDGGPERSWHINQPKTVIRLADLIPARVLVVNAKTGKRVGKATVHLTEEERKDPFLNVPPPLPLRKGHYEFTVFRGKKFAAALEVAPPEGMAAARFPFFLSGNVSVRAAWLEIVLPLWQEADVRLRVLREDGSIIKLPQFTEAKIGRDKLRVRSEPSGVAGVVKIRGVPLIPAEEVAARFLERESGFVAKLRLNRGQQKYETDALYWGLYTTPPLTAFEGGPRGGRSGQRRGPGSGRLQIGVEDRHGRPARFVLVRLTQVGGGYARSQRTTPNGNATFLYVPAGEFRAELVEPGFVYTAQEVELGVAGSALVRLREPKGRLAKVQVLDQDGYPAPYVRVSLKPEYGPEVVAIDKHEVQQGVLYTDHRGILRVEHLPHLRVTVEARRGSSWGKGSLEKDQASVTLHLTR